MLRWLRRYVAWLCVAVAAAGAYAIGVGWTWRSHVESVMANGREADAIIRRAQSITRKGLATYAIDLAWKTPAGSVRNASGVTVSESFADKVIVDGVLVVPTARIRYLQDAKGRQPVVIEDAGPQLTLAGRWQSIGIAAVLFGALGAFAFMRNWRRGGEAA